MLKGYLELIFDHVCINIFIFINNSIYVLELDNFQRKSQEGNHSYLYIGWRTPDIYAVNPIGGKQGYLYAIIYIITYIN